MEYSLLDDSRHKIDVSIKDISIVPVLFFFLVLFELFFMLGILRLGAQRGFPELSFIFVGQNSSSARK